MIKLKAPNDMTAPELVAEIRRRIEAREMSQQFNFNDLWAIINEPAPNPFTPDQIAWMRVEQIDNGIKYAAMNEHGIVSFFKDKPVLNVTTEGKYWGTGFGSAKRSSTNFLVSVLDVDDPEPLCFADYAPLDKENL